MLQFYSQFQHPFVYLMFWFASTQLSLCLPLYAESLALPEIIFQSRSSNYSDDVARATVFLRNFDKKAEAFQVRSGEVNWNYETDLTDKHLKEVIEIGEEVSSFYLQGSVNASRIKTLDLPEDLSRQISLIKRSSEPPQKELRMDIKKLIGEMTKLYGSAKVQVWDKKLNTTVNMTQSDIARVFKTSRDIKELNRVWKGWRDAVGLPTKRHFSSLIDLLNIGAREHGWIDYGDYLRREYEMSDLEESLDEVWTEIEPLYKELHAYVRYKLSHVYNISKDGCLPASLLGDLFAQDWENIFELVQPTEKSKTFDVTAELKNQKYTVPKMFKLAESFFTSIGLDPMPDTFWNRSVLTKQRDKEMVCHASAWDVGREDVRIKMCTEINQKDLTTVHHEMGHIEYFLAYKNQPTIFRAGANPGFHEAIGDTISLSVETPAYLKKVGLLKSSKIQEDDKISFLLNQALRRIAPIPYNFLVDKWRWRVFEGNITEENYNKAWWKLRVKYQGVEPPLLRPEDAFDPASKYHIGANVPYVPYFVSYVLQFQLQKKLCSLAGHKGPLYACSIQNSKNAGLALRKLLAAGRSHPWPKLLQVFSGEKTLKADAILEYFQPLKDWLHSQRKKFKYPIDWKEASSVEVLDSQEERFVIGQPQERSGISKSKEDDQATLSFNIPPDALKALLKNAQYGEQQNSTTPSTTGASDSTESSSPTTTTASNTGGSNTDETNTAQSHPPTLVDLTKLLTPSNQLSIKTSESAENNKDDQKNSMEINTGNSAALSDQNNKTSSTVESEANTSESMKNITATIPVNKEALVEKLTTLLKNEKGEDTGLKNAGLESNSSDKLTSSLNPETSSLSNGTTKNAQANQIALIPVSIPSQVLSALQSPQSQASNKSLNQGSGQALTNGDLNRPYDPKQEKNPSEDSKLYNGPAENNSTVVEPPSFSREDLLKILQKSLASKNNNNNPANSVAANLLPQKENSSTFANKTNPTPNTETTTISKEALLNELKKLKISPDNVKNPQQTVNANSTVLDSNTSSKENSKVENRTSSTAAEQNSNKDINEEITSGLRKLLGLYNISNPIVAKEKDGEKFIQAIESCKRFNENDPKCMMGKTITESTGIPILKNGIDESKQTVSISPSMLVQKLMEHKNAEDSTPDAVVNNVQPLINKSPNLSGKLNNNNKNTATGSSDQPSLDTNTLLSLLSDALGSSKKSIGSSNKRGNDALPSDQNKTDQSAIITQNIPKNCSKLFKRGFTISYNCNDLISNKTSVGVKGKVPLSTTDLLQHLLKDNKQVSASVPAAHLQKTSNGFQVKFDLHVKDQIPTEVSGTLKTLSSGRQQHVNIYNTPKGMFMKPKSSVQLLQPSFVPVKQNKDNIELGKVELSRKRMEI